VGLTPEQIFGYIIDILNFSGEIPLSKISQYLKNKTAQKEDLKNAVQKLYRKIKALADIQYQKEQEVARLSKMKETMTKTYKTFAILKDRLKQYGIGMENIDQFVKCVVGISKENYNHVQIVEKIADYEKLEKNSRYYNEQVNLKKDELSKLNQDIDRQQKIRNYFKIKLDIIDQLEIMGFGIQELRTLSEMLNEIGAKNNYSFDGIRKQFFDYVANIEEVMSSRKEIDRLKHEIKSLAAQTMKEREKYIAYPKIIESITRFTGAGIYEDDIVKIDKILTMSNFYLDKDKPFSKETLIDDLYKYGSLKLAIKNLENEINLKSKKRTRVQQIKKGPTSVKKLKEKKSDKGMNQYILSKPMANISLIPDYSILSKINPLL
jgi:hypothetical protein